MTLALHEQEQQHEQPQRSRVIGSARASAGAGRGRGVFYWHHFDFLGGGAAFRGFRAWVSRHPYVSIAEGAGASARSGGVVEVPAAHSRGAGRVVAQQAVGATSPFLSVNLHTEEVVLAWALFWAAERAFVRPCGLRAAARGDAIAQVHGRPFTDLAFAAFPGVGMGSAAPSAERPGGFVVARLAEQTVLAAFCDATGTAFGLRSRAAAEVELSVCHADRTLGAGTAGVVTALGAEAAVPFVDDAGLRLAVEVALAGRAQGARTGWYADLCHAERFVGAVFLGGAMLAADTPGERFDTQRSGAVVVAAARLTQGQWAGVYAEALGTARDAYGAVCARVGLIRVAARGAES